MRLFLFFLIGIGILTKGMALDNTHTQWNQWLKLYAHPKGPVTTVDYKAAKASPALLDAYLVTVESLTLEEYKRLSENDRLAFLINAYNALTVKWIIKNYPIKSIKETGGLFSSPWKKKFFKLFGEEQNLDGIEHETIRKQFNEPRIHFAVVCASKGCPALLGEAYIGDKLEVQLESSAKNFLNDPDRNRYDAEKNQFYLSKIFDWYGGDFKKKFDSVQNFVMTRMVKTTNPKMKEASISFLDYSWDLNETP